MTWRLATAFAAALAMTLACSGGAVAESDATAEEMAQLDKRIFGAEPVAKGNTYACFIRRYGAEHLARHPHQKVTSMKMLVTSEYFEDTESLAQHFRLGVTFRNKRGAFASSGSCNHFHPQDKPAETRLGCGVDCDGGGLDIGMGSDDSAVIVRLDRLRIWQNDKPDEGAATELVAGKDDAIFRLDRTGIEDCSSLVTDSEELAAMRPVGNRR